MSEARLWQYLLHGMGPRWVAQRHEDKYSTGIPDVSYSTNCHGWIELKFVAKAPVRATQPVPVPHFTAAQRNWIRQHGERGGRCFVLLQVERTFLLFSWDRAAMVGFATLSELKRSASRGWEDTISWSELATAISL